MNSIILTHFAEPILKVSCLDAAMDRLGEYLDAEIGSLEDLLDISDHEDAIYDIVSLRGLHLGASVASADIRQMLEGAQASLEHLLERVRSIPFEADLPLQRLRISTRWVRWSGARLEDILATLRHGLAA